MRHIVHSRLCRRRMCGIRLSTTGSRTRGYSPFRASRLSDAPTFGNKDNQKGVWKTRTWIAGGFQASGLIMSVYQWRLKDEKLNSRGLSSPWKPRHTPTGNRRKTGIGNMYNAHHPKNYVLLFLCLIQSPIVKHFYFCRQSHIGFIMNKNLPNIVQKQT